MFFFDCRILNHAPLFVEKKDVNFAWSVWNPTAGKNWFGHDVVKSQQRRLIDETYSCLTKLTAVILYLGGGFKYFLFSSLFGEMIQFDRYFSNGLKPPTSIIWILLDTRIWANCNGWKFFVKSDFSHGKEFPWKIKASPLKIPDRRRSEEIDATKNMGWLMIELGKKGRLFSELINIYTLGVISKDFSIYFCILGWCPWFLCDTFFSLHKPAL